MNTLRQAVQDYLNLRRSLGFKLKEAGRMLPDFVAQCRFEWNLTSSTIMASAVSHQILREPMFDVEPMH